ncbi:hypothetical protein SDC9_157599 [bioreactor metagenome]|uniref:Uncharacterized protein n=1 Tax=bioreactor metagenome TaxID=1076179 RepID=A0A645FCL4_9ZZZZ
MRIGSDERVEWNTIAARDGIHGFALLYGMLEEVAGYYDCLPHHKVIGIYNAVCVQYRLSGYAEFTGQAVYGIALCYFMYDQLISLLE